MRRNNKYKGLEQKKKVQSGLNAEFSLINYPIISL